MDKGFRIIEDLTSDIMFESYGKTVEQLFSNSAKALFSIICDFNHIKPAETREVTIEEENLEDLLFAWLQELIAMVDTEEMFFSSFEVDSVRNAKDHSRGKDLWTLKAKVYGEPIKPEKGELVVKAVTKYKYSLKKNQDGYKATFVVDI